jgi:hypothetical protein
MKKLQVSLPDDLREKLDAAVAESGNSLGEEIRQRLERTLEQDARSAVDPLTSELIRGIINLAASMQRDYKPWHSSLGLGGVFANAIMRRVVGYTPYTKGTAADLKQFAQDLGLDGLDASKVAEAPEAIGFALERADQRTHTYEHLQRLLMEALAARESEVRAELAEGEPEARSASGMK